ncbi:TIGR03084 family protein [Blastococcus sp. TML/C7B]|uniref:TIGR03084 family metal-binding protein n=1 Tax=Blastococcus sp. TML/C7B TaxID=2798728 RepID=UPI00190A9670|nr:TIGR03084 family metal-binding protein [Blastococcus sp. TML/C7B]MBN1097247.1 TIGR03084 family protein [Blastococcus sp. TML/C7B]
MTDVDAVAADLAAEHASLDAVLDGLTDQQWATPTPSPGWTVADQVGHLTYFDGAAVLALTDEAAFTASIGPLLEDMDGVTLHRHLAPAALLAAWRANRARLLDVVGQVDPAGRAPWYGPSMSVRSFLTARLMETWAHGHDVADAVGATREPTDRLRHICQIGFITRTWTYANRREEQPAGEVRLELTAPSGEVWRWGPDDAAESVRGPALDFCLVVTQRRHVDDTALETDGAAARDWMEKAQAFAGGATDGPPPGGRP